MISVDFSQPVDRIRVNIGDPDKLIVDDNTITSCLATYGNNVYDTTIILMNMILAKISLEADRTREGEVEMYFTNLYKNYKDRLNEYKKNGDKIPSKGKGVGIIIGGTNVKDKVRIASNLEYFNPYDLNEWHNMMLSSGDKFYVDFMNQPLRYSI